MPRASTRGKGDSNTGAGTDQPRLFIGISPDAPTQHFLEGLVIHARQLLSSGRERPRWTSPSNRHLTLAFLGETPPELIPAIERGLMQMAQGARPCSGRIVSLGPFPKPRARLLAAELVSNPDLDRLHSGCRELMRDLGMKPESAAFRPHFTLGRNRHGLGPFPPLQLDYVARLDNLVLYRSEMAPGGSQYTPLFEALLGGPEENPART
ncbi:RNA 2',3'-cyclic phosphodiesterase [Microbulbifer yueqingensis]|uniref:RNA 2',3'-cyclic phosphodiesterase n=1 Tax=Microbulbifer yueqingensis TaxID=658219 RepID=A0A1G9AH48_9GAMM|nr:RNA 2',3'-cyclic phosphodiesterase [Microbulbifer yueqingensis]SDK26679.1 2'-5' RNA ligase [Microbulbifer yueqingensis]